MGPHPNEMYGRLGDLKFEVYLLVPHIWARYHKHMKLPSISVLTCLGKSIPVATLQAYSSH